MKQLGGKCAFRLHFQLDEFAFCSFSFAFLMLGLGWEIVVRIRMGIFLESLLFYFTVSFPG
jgi:hypothetical protein